MKIVKQGRHSGSSVAPSRLSPREREVVRLLATGMTVRAIALQLGCAPSTIGAHVVNARHKTGTATGFELAVKAATGEIDV